MNDNSKKSGKKDIQALQQKAEELTQALQRERADAINLRRRHETEIANLKDHLKATVVKDLLPVIDNFERAIGHIPEDIKDNDFVKGVQAIVKQFEKTLADIGVERIKTVGEEFNPEYHEAVSVEEGEGSKEIVSEELQAGYKLGDDIIRHAIVRVSRK